MCMVATVIGWALPAARRGPKCAGSRAACVSAGALRGFCTGCGSSLYFRASDGAFSVEAGAVDGPTGSRLAGHIHMADAGDYYVLDDGLPQRSDGE